MVLLDQDEIRIDGRPFRVHVHGVASAVHPPERLRTFKRAVGIAAAVLLTGAPTLAAEPTPPIEVRQRPPEPMPNPNWRRDAGVELVPSAEKPGPAKTPAPDAGSPAPKTTEKAKK